MKRKLTRAEKRRIRQAEKARYRKYRSAAAGADLVPDSFLGMFFDIFRKYGNSGDVYPKLSETDPSNPADPAYTLHTMSNFKR